MKNRKEIIKLLTKMDDEAFSWLIIAIPPGMHDRRTQIWPDGLGGFRDKETIEKLRDEAAKWLAN